MVAMYVGIMIQDRPSNDPEIPKWFRNLIKTSRNPSTSPEKIPSIHMLINSWEDP
jgi:hypothetical protein